MIVKSRIRTLKFVSHVLGNLNSYAYLVLNYYYSSVPDTKIPMIVTPTKPQTKTHKQCWYEFLRKKTGFKTGERRAEDYLFI